MKTLLAVLILAVACSAQIINPGNTGNGTVTNVTGTANQIGVATGTTTPVISITNPFTFPGTVSNNLSIFGATTSAQFFGVISDETGSGLVVGATSPTLTTPTIADFTNATHNHQNAAGGGTLANAALTNSAITIAVTAPITGGGSTALGATSAAIACATCTTNAAALTSNAVVKGAGGQAAAADATLSDDGTTLAYTGTAVQTPQGACASTPALKFGSTGTVGVSQGGAAAQIGLTDGTLCRFLFVVGAAMTERMGSGGILGWTSTAGDASGTIDTTLSRSGINHVQVGSTTNNSNGGVDAAGFFSKGTTFTGNAGCSETTLVGGATAGKFTAVSTSCTIIVTMGNSMAAPTGWDCNVQDLTTAADAHNPRQSASTTTTATFITGTIISSDVISFHCVGY